MAKFINEDGELTFPHAVDSIDAVPKDYRDWYVPHVNGKWRLLAHIKAALEPLQSEVARLKKDLEEAPAKHEARLARERAEWKQERVTRKLKETFKAAGVKQGLIDGAVALVSDGIEFEVEDAYDGNGYVVLAQTKAGFFGADVLVERFLESEEGAGFRGKPTAPSDGYFSSLMADLKQRR